MITQEELPMVAIPSMNDTHLEEMMLINKLDTAARANKVTEVAEILNELLEHTSIHFFEEEDRMEEALFPAYQSHKAEHDRYLHEFRSLIKYFDEHKDTRAIYTHIEGNMERWLIHHIKTMDTMTALYLKEGNLNSCAATKGCTTESC